MIGNSRLVRPRIVLAITASASVRVPASVPSDDQSGVTLTCRNVRKQCFVVGLLGTCSASQLAGWGGMRNAVLPPTDDLSQPMHQRHRRSAPEQHFRTVVQSSGDGGNIDEIRPGQAGRWSVAPSPLSPLAPGSRRPDYRGCQGPCHLQLQL